MIIQTWHELKWTREYEVLAPFLCLQLYRTRCVGKVDNTNDRHRFIINIKISLLINTLSTWRISYTISANMLFVLRCIQFFSFILHWCFFPFFCYCAFEGSLPSLYYSPFKTYCSLPLRNQNILWKGKCRPLKNYCSRLFIVE